MTKILTLITAVVFFVSCAQFPIGNVQITAATSAGLLLIKDTTKRTEIANYIDVYASACRKITGNATPDQLVALLDQYVPASIRAQYPELVALAEPLIVEAYTVAYNKYKGNVAKLYQELNAIAGDLEAGAAPYIGHS